LIHFNYRIFSSVVRKIITNSCDKQIVDLSAPSLLATLSPSVLALSLPSLGFIKNAETREGKERGAKGVLNSCQSKSPTPIAANVREWDDVSRRITWPIDCEAVFVVVRFPPRSCAG